MIRCALLPVGLLVASVGQAQGATGDSTLVRCNGQTITKISYEPMGPEFGGKSASSSLVTGLVRKLHANSRAQVVREFTQLREGEPCREIKRTETERLLRAQWFIQDARVLVYPDRGGVQLIVATVDEVSIIASAGVAGTEVRSLLLGNTNLMGRGLLVETGWRDNGVLRDGRTLRLRSAITFGRPIQTNVNWRRFGLGNQTDAELRYPFLTDLQRLAFRAIIGKDDDYVRFVRDTGDLPFQRVSRSFGSVGGVMRIGRPGALLLAGASMSYDGERVGNAVVVTDSGAIPFGSRIPVPPVPTQSATRLNLLFGGRAMRFITVEGFDALTGAQDLRVGTQFSGQFGRTLKLEGLSTADYFLAGELYAGWGTQRGFVGTEWVFSGRRADITGWDGRLVSGRTAAYFKPSRKSTSIASVELTAGEDVRTPFQIPLGQSRLGLRGFRNSLDGGGSRAIIRLEQRQALGRPWGFADVGTLGFVETGKLWAGTVPYGVETPWRSSIGTGLLLAIPPRSRRMYRFDIVYGLNPDLRSKRFEYRLSSGNFTRTFWQDPDETQRARERSLISNLFSF